METRCPRKYILKITTETGESIDTFILDFKGRLQWKNDLGLYFSLVLVMKIGMCDLVIFRLV